MTIYKIFGGSCIIISRLILLNTHSSNEKVRFQWTMLHDNKQCCAATLTDLSKAFDSISYGLLIAKLNVNGFDQEAWKIIHS